MAEHDGSAHAPQKRSNQRCFVFQLSVNPRARIFGYTDSYGNLVHHFDLPARHSQLTIISDALVNIEARSLRFRTRCAYRAWQELEELIEERLLGHVDAEPFRALLASARAIGGGDWRQPKEKSSSPLAFLHDINSGIYHTFSYVKKSTAVNSPIEDALRSRQGVCQDFAHIMIALVRNARIPCRYVSGYLYHGAENGHPVADGATHAWVEALLPGLGWVGFDPTINRLASEQHIRTATGRDYADVPPTMGVMKGKADTQLQVRVRVTPSQAVLPPDEEFAADEEWSQFLDETQQSELAEAQQQQQ